MTVEKKDLDWGSLDFGYRKTDYSYVANWKDGEWDEGGLTADHEIHLSECAGIFHYCQEVFEGLKAYTTEDGSIVCFRPDMNAERMYNSAQRLEMPGFPQERFIEAVKQVVKANAAWVPPLWRHAVCSPVHDWLWRGYRRCSRTGIPVPHLGNPRRPLLQGRLEAHHDSHF